jgi:pyruvate dehydrogenase E1 component alpha subunit
MASESQAPIVDDATARTLFKEMTRMRLFEEETSARSDDGEIPGFLHLDRGHEGNHAAMSLALEADDWVAVGGSRLVGQYIAKGVPFEDIMAELYGKRDGSNRGKGGQMHVADVDRNLYGHAATIGSGQNPATGLALAQQMLDTGQVVLTTIGDGGTSRGSFHTALIFAAYWDLPIVFLIENNHWAISTPAENLPLDTLADYGAAVNMPTCTVKGWNVEEVYQAVSEAVNHARSGDGPIIVESEVYRLVGHFEGDPESYRDDGELADFREKYDPVTNYQERLMANDIVDEEEYETMVEDIEQDIQTAVEFARESEFPNAEEAYDNVLQTPLYGQGD